jgi:hypothetical protein
MFGSKRRKLVDKVYHSVLPYVAAVEQSIGGMPPGFWEDPFVIGFFTFQVGLTLKLAGGDQLSPEEKGLATCEILGALSHTSGVQITRSMTHLALSKDTQSGRGADVAQLVSLYPMGMLKDGDRHPAVAELKLKMPQADPVTISGMLYHSMFIVDIKRRLSAK